MESEKPVRSCARGTSFPGDPGRQGLRRRRLWNAHAGPLENGARHELWVVPHGAVPAILERDEARVSRQFVAQARLGRDQSFLLAPGDGHGYFDVVAPSEALPPGSGEVGLEAR